jgi:thiamine pyrophosphate-dependent acetolactate synthase large subunit-like protein
VFGARGRLPGLDGKTLELEDALAAAYAADGYSRATGDAAILVTAGRIEALRVAPAIPVSWGDRIPLIVVNLIPEEDAELVRLTYKPVVRGSIVMQPAETVEAVVARLREELGHGLPVQLIGSVDADVRVLLAAISQLDLPLDAAAEPAAADVERIVKALQPLERPVLLLGREGVLRADLASVAKLAAKIRCPVLLTAAAAGIPQPWETISDQMPLIPNPNAAWVLILLRADGILALGTGLSEGDLFGLHDIRLIRGRMLCVGQREIGAPDLCHVRIQHDPGSPDPTRRKRTSQRSPFRSSQSTRISVKIWARCFRA